MTTSPVIEHACGLPLVLRAAQAATLPEPAEIVVDEKGAHLAFAEVSDLDVWSAYLGEPVQMTRLPFPGGDVIRHTISATLFDLPILVWSVATS